MATITNEGLAIEIKNLSLQIAELKNTIATNHTIFITKDVFELRMKELDLRILDLQSRKSFLTWILPTVSAVLGSLFTFLVLEYFRK